MKSRMLTQGEIDALSLAILREMWQRVMRLIVFGVVSLGLVGMVGVLGFWFGLRQAGY